MQARKQSWNGSMVASLLRCAPADQTQRPCFQRNAAQRGVRLFSSFIHDPIHGPRHEQDGWLFPISDSGYIMNTANGRDGPMSALCCSSHWGNGRWHPRPAKRTNHTIRQKKCTSVHVHDIFFSRSRTDKKPFSTFARPVHKEIVEENEREPCPEFSAQE